MPVVRGGARTAARGAAALGSAATLVLAAWLVWLLPGPQLAAVLGLGPVDGVVTVSECYEATDAEGYAAGTQCKGRYTPRGHGGPQEEILLETAAAKHRPGSEVEVRTARGRAYERSGFAVGNLVVATGLLLVPFLALAAWMSACARRGRAVDGGGFVLAALAAMVAVVVLGVAAGVLVGILTAVL
ncbi:hypothetical protein [Streptomyces sp. NBC_00091]|uniref:hypothetical protein n=1 Tax=Streptomyces sp. NBC_00091 TaxID=2975648 RepID=UPI002253496C|nr:hypothetical protein [Streptomyces sp. NBC_00091]MCX5380570.1 hypothetical protein [Streptomyces sp. NBC_00091]